MKTHLYKVMLIAILLFQSGCTHDEQIAEPSRDETVMESPAINTDTENPIIIDVRSQEEWDAGHLEQAILVPHEELPEKIASITKDKSAKLVLY